MFELRRTPKQEEQYKKQKAKEAQIASFENELKQSRDNLDRLLQDLPDENLLMWKDDSLVSIIAEEIPIIFEKLDEENREKDVKKHAEIKNPQNPHMERFLKLNQWFNELLLQNAALGANPAKKLNKVRDLSIEYIREAINELSPTLCSSFSCNLTGKMMQDPVIATDGYHYERKAIEDYLKAGNNKSPVTGEKLIDTKLVSNVWLQTVIGEVITIAETRQTLRALNNEEIDQEIQNKRLEIQFELLNRRVVGLRSQNGKKKGNLHEEKLFDTFLANKGNGNNGQAFLEQEEVKPTEKEEKEGEKEQTKEENKGKKGKQKNNERKLSHMFLPQEPPNNDEEQGNGFKKVLKSFVGLGRKQN